MIDHGILISLKELQNRRLSSSRRLRELPDLLLPTHPLRTQHRPPQLSDLRNSEVDSKNFYHGTRQRPMIFLDRDHKQLRVMRHLYNLRQYTQAYIRIQQPTHYRCLPTRPESQAL
jgi:hypothetical protein